MARGMHKGPNGSGTSSLDRRRNVYDAHGKNPGANPSNSTGQGHDMHRPGSNKK